jgi:hypothetical protein
MVTIQDLKNIMANTENKIEKLILSDAIEHGEDYAIGYLKDVVTHGCVSGVVSRLIYYSDTHNFFDTYYDEIMQTIEEYETETGEKPQYDGDMKNWYAWFAYEWYARKVLNKLEIEY